SSATRAATCPRRRAIPASTAPTCDGSSRSWGSLRPTSVRASPRGFRRERHLDGDDAAAGEALGRAGTEGAKEGQHAGVLDEHVGAEAGHAALARRRGEALEEDPPEPLALVVVDDREGGLRDLAAGLGANEAADADALAAGERADREVVAAVDLGQVGQLGGSELAARHEEAQHARPRRHPREAALDERLVVGAHRSELDDRSVVER